MMVWILVIGLVFVVGLDVVFASSLRRDVKQAIADAAQAEADLSRLLEGEKR